MSRDPQQRLMIHSDSAQQGMSVDTLLAVDGLTRGSLSLMQMETSGYDPYGFAQYVDGSGTFQSETPRSQVLEPTTWFGNLNAYERRVSQGQPGLYVRCMGQRLDQNDPVNAPPPGRGTNYNYHGKEEISLLRILEAWVKCWVKDSETTPSVLTDGKFISMTVRDDGSGQLECVLFPPKEPYTEHMDLLFGNDHAWEVVEIHLVDPLTNPKRPVFYESRPLRLGLADKGLSLKRQDPPRMRHHMRSSSLGLEQAPDQALARRGVRSSSQQRYSEASKWVHDDIVLRGSTLDGSETHGDHLPRRELYPIDIPFLWRWRESAALGIDPHRHKRINRDLVRIALLLPSTSKTSIVQIACVQASRKVRMEKVLRISGDTDMNAAYSSRIHINGQCHRVPAAFDVFLRSIRSKSESLFLQSDLLCANWDNLRDANSDYFGTTPFNLNAMDHLDWLSESELRPFLQGEASNRFMRRPNLAYKRNHRNRPGVPSYYIPLDRVAGEIRTLVFDCDVSPEAPPRLFIKTVSLRSVVNTYFALSYNWGTRHPTRTIYINEEAVEVGQNLFDFLRMCQGTRFKEAPWWIDALCINQNDLQEKGREVARMAQIYEGAAVTYVWLGKKPWEQTIPARFSSISWGTDPTDFVPAHAAFFDTIFKQPYFQRCWCTQELVLSKNVSVLLGGQIFFPWFWLSNRFMHHQYCGLMRQFSRRREPAAEHHSNLKEYWEFLKGNPYHRVDSINSLRKQQAQEKRTLLSLLFHTMNLDCSLPVDKLYSLWSLACDSEILMGEPQYMEPTAETFTRFARACIEKNESLNILSAVLMGPSLNSQGVPGWVPNWCDGRLSTPLLAIAGICRRTVVCIESQSTYQASLSTKPVYRLNMDAQGGPQLSVGGILVDKVTKVGDPDSLGGTPPWIRDVYGHLIATGKCWVDLELLENAPEEQKDFIDGMVAGSAGDGTRLTPFSAENYTVKLTRGRLGIKYSKHVLTGRRLVITERGHVGFAPLAAKQGDVVVVVFGCGVPLLLRQFHDDRDTFRLVGEVYLRRYMEGEAIRESGSMEECMAAARSDMAVSEERRIKSGKGRTFTLM